jgi:hypothetical protein
MYTSDASKFPYLKGKAAELRHFGKALQYAFSKYMIPDNKQHKEVKLMLDICNSIEAVLDKHATSYRLPDGDAKMFEQACWDFVALDTALANFYHPQHILLFNFTPKFHYILHIGLVSRYINPRLGWCYSGEDFMQKIKQIVQASHSGAGPQTVVSKAILKYVQGLSLSFVKDIWK